MKYLIYNDLSYLYHKKKTILILVIFLPLLIGLIYGKGQFLAIDIIKICVGADFDINDINVFSLLMLLFNVFSFIYLIVNVYSKDLDDSLENIFLRVKPIKYILKKNICFMLSTFFIKVLQYSLMVVCLLFFQKKVIFFDILEVFMIDVIYILLLQYIFLAIYLIYILVNKKLFVLIILSLILIICYPKNIWNAKNYIVYMLLLLILIHICINWIFDKKAKKLIENV